MDRDGAFRLFIDYFILIVLFFPVNQQASFSSGTTLSRRQRKVDANPAVIQRDTRSPTSGSVSTAASLNVCSKFTDSDSLELNSFNSSCLMCAVSTDVREKACPLHSRPVGNAVRGCVFETESAVFAFEGCNFECVVDTERTLTLRECCPGYWGPLCSECPGGSGNPCSSHGRCADGRNGTGSCFCRDGYTGTACEICSGDSCPEKHMCSTNYDCHVDAVCKSRSWDQTFCQCRDGYHGDGVDCYSINPCLKNSHRCPANTSLCIHNGPNQYHCECRPGYTDFQGRCLRDECLYNTSLRSCRTGTECTTVSPGQVVCQCSSGYVGNGLVCYGSVMERLEHLNGEGGDLEGRLTQALLLLEASLMHRWLKDRDVFYTVFLPVDEASQFVNSEFAAQLKAGLLRGSDDRADVFLETVAKLHIVFGYVDSYALKRIQGIYTLAGQKIIVDQGSTYLTIGLEGSGEVARVIHSDLPASNGVIHIIDRVFLPPTGLSTRVQGSLLDVLSTYSNLRTFTEIIKRSNVVQSVLESEEVSLTLFAVTDDALLRLSPEISSLLISSTSRWENFVRQFTYHHVAPIQLSTHDLMKAGYVQSYVNDHFEIRVSENGRITVAGLANITTPDIAAFNGVIHIIDATLLDILPSLTETCFKNLTEGQNQECCEGFYTQSCIQCPSVCRGNGQCEDGMEGSGACICDAGFNGVECQDCRDSTMFGPYCNQSCSCIHGVCSNGPLGTGHCQLHTCLPGYIGEDCHLHTTPCGPQEDQCHAHSMCIIEEGVPRCVCNTHYTGSGTDCLPINPCQGPDQGGCDPAVAECVYIGPGMHRCGCKDGYAGQGDCTPRDRCLTDNGGCHRDASCLHQFALDFIECVCNFGFEGNGYACEPINACLRLHDCDAEAHCETTGPGTYECICPPGLELHHRNCFSNLAVELSSLSDAEPFWQLIQAISLDGFISHTDHSIGVIVPSPHTIQLINSTTGGALGVERIIAYFVRSNMLMMDRSQRYLNQTLPSLQPGENVVINGPYGNLSTVNGHIAEVENTTNGLIFHPISYPEAYWINRLLEVQEKSDLLAPSSRDVQDFSQAWKMMQASGLLPLGSSAPYTVFLPDNLAMSTFNWSAVNQDDFLQHHLVIGKTLYSHNISEELNVTTVSGQHVHLLVSSGVVSVDMIPIEAPDILLLPDGIAHGIPGTLSPSLREGTCDDGMNGGCHQRARCIQKTSTSLQCRCMDGYHGNGMECVGGDPCFHDNGGCHFRAACIPVGQSERRCSCNSGYEGDGFICRGSIFEELRSMPEASLFVEFLENLDSRSFLMGDEGRFTVFVPSNEAVTAFLQHQGFPQEWREERYTYLLMQYVLYHVIAGSHMTMADLRNHTIVGMMNGQDLDISINQDGNTLLGASGIIISADLNASNGIIHIIDTVLTPPRIYEWPSEQDMGFGSDEADRRPYPNFGRDMGVLGTGHNITTFLRLLQLTPMFREFFIDAHPRPGHGGPPPGGPPPHGPPPRRPPFHHPPPHRPTQRMTGWHDGGSREDERGQWGYRGGAGGGSPEEESSGVEETMSGEQRGIYGGDASGGFYGGRGGGSSIQGRQGRHQSGSSFRLGDPKFTEGGSGLSRDIHGKHGGATGLSYLTDHGDGYRHQRNMVYNNQGRYQKRSLDRPFGSPPSGWRPPHGMRHGGRFETDSTIFAPTDEAFRRLPPGKLEELIAPGNSLLLQEFIAHHVLPDERYFDDLWPKAEPYAVPSLQGSDLRISILGQGQLFVNERSRVIGVGLEFEGGVLFPVSEVISLPTMYGRCDIIQTHNRMSRCKECGSPMCPPNAEQVGAEQPGCLYRDGWYSSKIGCQADCQFTEVTRACCLGYHGPSCQECPGGSTFPCNNHGRCNEGYHNDGVCSCKEGFTGTACERCLPGFYGPSCRKCRCSNSSICYGESGECFCSADTDGPLCEHILTSVPACDPPCHQNAVCRYGNRCQCSPQYHGDGYTCNSINKCFTENGGCSVHATCTHNASAISVNCTCHDGFHGDGVVCLPVNLCEKEDNGGCHPNATCRFRGPNARSCVCRPPYWGDGLECRPPVTSCLSNNGGCSPNAHCREGGDGGPVKCTCFSGYVGDGILCNGNLYDTLASQPEFYHFFKMVMQLANTSYDGERLVRDLLKPHDPLTIFIPLNPELSGLTFYPSQVLLHVVHDRWSREDLLEEGEEDEDLETWSGHELNVDVTHDDQHQAIVTIEDVPVVKFGMEATNGVIHMIEAPLPIWMMLDYDKDDGDEEKKHSSRMKSGWNSSSRIFAAVAVPLGLLAFTIVVVLYWFRGRKLEELTHLNQGQAMATTSGSVQGAEANRSSMALAATQTPPISPVSSVDQGDIQYSEFDQLMAEETGEKLETHLETRC